jgi:GNAT superfamily N-acetyltransferase
VNRPEIAVTVAGPDRRAVLASLFGRAFVDEPMMRWPLGPHGDVAVRFARGFSYFFENALGLDLVLEAGPGRGGAVWIPPGQFDSWESHPWNQPRIDDLTDDGGRRYDAFWRWVEAHSPEEPLWQLDSVAVEPADQGRGYGAALIRAGQARASAAGMGASLSTGTPGNVDIYQHCGFHVVEDLDAPNEGPHIWFMRWDPASAIRRGTAGR